MVKHLKPTTARLTDADSDKKIDDISYWSSLPETEESGPIVATSLNNDYRIYKWGRDERSPALDPAYMLVQGIRMTTESTGPTVLSLKVNTYQGLNHADGPVSDLTGKVGFRNILNQGGDSFTFRVYAREGLMASQSLASGDTFTMPDPLFSKSLRVEVESADANDRDALIGLNLDL